MSAPAHVPVERIVDVNIYDLPGMKTDYSQSWHDLQQVHPELIWTPQNEGHWIALRSDVLIEVQSDHERFSSRVIVIPKTIGELHGLIPTTIDPPEHRPYRLLLNESMNPSVVRGMASDIRSIAIEMINEISPEGYCDFTQGYARIFPIRIFMRMVELPMCEASKIQLWAESMTRPKPQMPFEEARQAFFDYLTPVLAERKQRPGTDLLSSIVTSKIKGLPIEPEKAVSLATQILIAGVDTVVNFLGFCMLYMAQHPLARHLLAAKPEMIPQATHELFRRFGLVTIGRIVRNDMEFRGVQLKAGDMIALPTAVHGMDDAVNEQPMTVDFNRTRGRHSAFGNGPHMCPGQELARAEVAITLEEWLKAIPDFDVADESDLSVAGGIVGSIQKLCLKWETSV